jgi:hypothetical protein
MTRLLDAAFLIAGALALGVHVAVAGGLDEVSFASVLLVAAAAVALLAFGTSIATDRAMPAIVAGLFLSALLLAAQDGRGLSWRLADPSASGGAGVRGVGIVLGVMLLSCLGGTLLLIANRLSGGASARATMVGRRMQILAVALGVIAIGLVAREVWAMPTGALAGISRLAAGLVAGTWLLASGCFGLLSPDRKPAEHDALRFVTVAACLTAAALLVFGFEGWQRHGSYLAGASRATLVAALGGIAAAQPTALSRVRTLLFTVALLMALVG